MQHRDPFSGSRALQRIPWSRLKEGVFGGGGAALWNSLKRHTFSKRDFYVYGKQLLDGGRETVV
ncbi:MAG: hypothetical protein OSJ53_02440 [Kineothrix sp.]|nr:hypothetical protein [Kineothrix sp.]